MDDYNNLVRPNGHGTQILKMSSEKKKTSFIEKNDSSVSFQISINNQEVGNTKSHFQTINELVMREDTKDDTLDNAKMHHLLP